MVAVGATLMFRAKEVLPVTKKVFWDDLKTARRIYQGRALDSVTGEALTTEQVGIVSLNCFLIVICIHVFANEILEFAYCNLQYRSGSCYIRNSSAGVLKVKLGRGFVE